MTILKRRLKESNMWIVLKYKTKEFYNLKKNLKILLGNEPEYFMPQIKYYKIVNKKFKSFKKLILDGYLICSHPKFKNNLILKSLNYTQGIKYVLNGFENNQIDIINFINKCKNFQDKDGFIKQDFFNNKNFVRGKFISGPFTNLVFSILSKKSDRIEILIGKYKTTLTKKNNYLYQPV